MSPTEQAAFYDKLMKTSLEEEVLPLYEGGLYNAQTLLLLSLLIKLSKGVWFKR